MKLLLLLFLFLSLEAEKPDLLLLNKYSNDVNITSWCMSEKLDGVRAYWNGEKLISRNGKVFPAPAFFTKAFPKTELDGELWSKRGDFSNVSSIVNTRKLDSRIKSENDGVVKPENDGVMMPENETTSVILDSDRESRWTQLTYNIFEVPNAVGNLTQRLSKVKESKYLRIIKQIKVKNKTHLNDFLKEIEKKGGEGVVVRDGSLTYYTGRNNNALKVKSYIDEECEVVGYNRGNGKYKSVMGSLLCKMKNDKVIKIGTGFKEKQRVNPPNIGDIITFKYYGLTSLGNPRFPIFLREKRLF